MQLPSPTTLQKILSSLRVFFGPDFINYPSSDFTRYVSPEYLKSERHETDEAYRMFEPSLLHHESGLRITYTTTESYDGESTEYKLIDLFVITPDKRQLAVTDVDFEKKLIVTPGETLPFSTTNKDPDPDHPVEPKESSPETSASFIEKLRQNPHGRTVAQAMLGLYKSRRNPGSKAEKIKLLEAFLREIEEKEERGAENQE